MWLKQYLYTLTQNYHVNLYVDIASSNRHILLHSEAIVDSRHSVAALNCLAVGQDDMQNITARYFHHFRVK